MATTPTNNAIPSEDIRDLKFNSGKIDEFTSSGEEFYKDRLGVNRYTLAGIAKNASLLSEPYLTIELAQADINEGKIKNDGVFGVVSTSVKNSIDIYSNNNGVPLFTGRSTPSTEFVNQVNTLATGTDARTEGLKTEADSLYPFEVLDRAGKAMLFVDDGGIFNAPGGVKSKSMTVDQFSPENISTPSITALSEPDDSFPLAEITPAGQVLFATDPKTGKKIYLGEPLNNHRGPLSGDCFVIGDSLPAYGVAWSGDNNTGENRAPCLNDKGFYTWAMIQSLGRIRVTGVSATGGYSVSQVLTTHLKNAIKANPTFCPVMCGRNDVIDIDNNIDIETQTIPSFKSIFRALRRAGIIPVVCTMAAQSNGGDNTRRTKEHRLNNWLRAYARAYRLPLIDFHRYTVDPATGNWLSGYNRDASHPTGEGAKAMGKAMVDGLLHWTATTYPPRADEQVAVGLTANLLANPLFLNNDGTNPIDWTVLTTGTASITQDPAVKGNVWNLSNHTASLSVTAVPGSRYQFGVFMKTAGSNLFECYALSGSSESTTHLAGVRKWGTATDGWGYFCYEFVVPESTSSITLKINAAASQCSVAQIGLIEITEI